MAPSDPASGELLLPLDPRWPLSLQDLARPPRALWMAGEPVGDARRVAIVGTRAADPEALELAHALAFDLANAGVVVVSGGASGIDAAAHRGALDAGGRTVVVLASGLRPPYPAQNASLFEEVVARRGVLLSEVPDGTAPRAGLFLSRNRLIAALAGAVVVVQAPARSGALSTARHARALGRPLFVVPHAPWEERGQGNVALLRQGARVCAGAEDVLWGSAPAARGAAEAPTVGPGTADGLEELEEDERVVLGALGARARHFDELAQRSGLGAGPLRRVLVSLELAGLAQLTGGGRYRRVTRRR